MKTKTFIIVNALAGLLLYGGSWLVDWNHEAAPGAGEPESTASPRSSGPGPELEERVTSFQSRARERQVAARTARTGVRSRAEAPLVPEQRHESLPSEAPGNPAPETNREEIVSLLDARFFSEAFDPAWGREAKHRAEQLCSMLSAGARVVSLECRSSMCRMEMSHPSLESFQGFIRKGLLEEDKWDGGFMAAIKSDPSQPGSVESVAYLARNGVDLASTSLLALDGPR